MASKTIGRSVSSDLDRMMRSEQTGAEGTRHTSEASIVAQAQLKAYLGLLQSLGNIRVVEETLRVQANHAQNSVEMALGDADVLSHAAKN